MLTILLPGDEFWDYDAELFRYDSDVKLEFEHSLVSLSKWEARFHKIFLTDEKKSEDEILGYIEAMLVTDNVDLSVLDRLTTEDFEKIDSYINDPMTGTTINDIHQRGPRSSELISSELIYYWMSQFHIDKGCEHWHLNRLLTLIKVHHAKSQKEKKIPRYKQAQSMAEINAARRAKYGTTG